MLLKHSYGALSAVRQDPGPAKDQPCLECKIPPFNRHVNLVVLSFNLNFVGERWGVYCCCGRHSGHCRCRGGSEW